MHKPFQLLVVLSALITLAHTSLAADKTLIENAVNGTTIAIVRVDSSQIEISPKLLELAQKDSTGSLGELTRIATKPVQQVKDLLRGEQGYFAIDLPYSPRAQARLLASINVPEAQLKSLAQLVWPNSIGEARRAAGWRTIPLGITDDGISTPPIDAKLIASQIPAWESALQATSTHSVQLVVVNPSYVRETIAELDPELPRMLGGGSAKTILSGVAWLSLGIDPRKATMQLIVQAESAETAEAVKSHIPKLFRGLLEGASLDQNSSTMLVAVLGLLQPKVRDTQVILSLEDSQADALLQLAAVAIAATAEPVAVTQTQNNLKQLALGLHNYHSAFNALPTYHKMEQSKGLSWRVHILPFIDHEDLYKEFHLDEAWDSPHNIRLLDRMPQVFKPVIPLGSNESSKPFHTTYVAPIGERTVFGQDKIVDFQHVTDGTSNTVIFVELKPEHAIPWTSPEEYRFDPANPAAKLRSVNGRVSTAYMDGSVRTILQNEPASVWNAVFSRNGGELVNIK
jgi:Protein of unknown function (DUF1559)